MGGMDLGNWFPRSSGGGLLYGSLRRGAQPSADVQKPQSGDSLLVPELFQFHICFLFIVIFSHLFTDTKMLHDNIDGLCMIMTRFRYLTLPDMS